MRVDFHDIGNPLNGIRKIKIPRKKVDFRLIIATLYTRDYFSQNLNSTKTARSTYSLRVLLC